MYIYIYIYIYTHIDVKTHLYPRPTTDCIISAISVASGVTILFQSVERRPQGAIGKRKGTYLIVSLLKDSLQHFESQKDDFSHVSQGHWEFQDPKMEVLYHTRLL